LLTNYIIGKYNQENSMSLSLDEQASKALKTYSFPGNIRELENILERATALCDGNIITVDDLQLPNFAEAADIAIFNLPSLTKNIEKEQIMQALEQNKWNQSAAARTLGITLRQLRYKIEKLELNRP
jgi:two-component system response regulator PilR (NtrC family)